jgi:hypothetical protein
VESRGTKVHSFGTNNASARLEMILSIDPEKSANSVESEASLRLPSPDFSLP